MKWDKGLDYEKTYKKLVKLLNEYKSKNGIRNLTRLCYIIVLLTQLRNGSRISESFEFIRNIANNFKRQDIVRVRKHKTIEYRLMILPREVRKNDILKIAGIINKTNINNVKVWCRENLGFNTHALRYAFVSYLAKRGISPQIIAKITKHKNLNYIVTYTQEKLAEEILQQL